MRNTAVFGLFAMLLFLLTSCGGGQENGEKGKSDETLKKEAAPTGPVTYNVNSKSSTAAWKGSMLGMYDHEGTVMVKDGTVTVENGKITKGKFTIDLTSITPTDENYDAKEGRTQEKLVGHLSSPDFFDVANHPTAKFVIVSVGNGEVKGDMTVRGVTDTEKITVASHTVEGKNLTLKGNMKFDRQKYGVAFKHPAQEMVLSDDIEMNFDIVATAK